MTPLERYTVMAAQLRAKARKEQSLHVKSAFESLAQCYSVLAQRAQPNGQHDAQDSLNSQTGGAA